jgi:protein-disulfide isomerase
MAKSLFSVIFLVCATLGAILYFSPVYPNAKQATVLYNPVGTSIAGNPEGSITLVEFFDYRCPYCQKEETILETLIKENPDIRLIHKAFPLFGETSEAPIRAVFAANFQGAEAYLTMHHYLLFSPNYLDEKQIDILAKAANLNMPRFRKEMKSARVTKFFNDNIELAKELDIHGTPAFFVTQTALLKNLDHIDSFKQNRHTGFMTLHELEKYVSTVSP